MNKPLTISIAITFLLASACLLIFQKSSASKPPIAEQKIAIFYPTISATVTNIEQAIIKTMREKGNKNYIFTIYNADGDLTLLRNQAQEILNNNYDLIFPIGAECTQILYEYGVQKSQTTPIVFVSFDGIKPTIIDQQAYPITGFIFTSIQNDFEQNTINESTIAEFTYGQEIANIGLFIIENNTPAQSITIKNSTQSHQLNILQELPLTDNCLIVEKTYSGEKHKTPPTVGS